MNPEADEVKQEKHRDEEESEKFPYPVDERGNRIPRKKNIFWNGNLPGVEYKAPYSEMMKQVRAAMDIINERDKQRQIAREAKIEEVKHVKKGVPKQQLTPTLCFMDSMINLKD